MSNGYLTTHVLDVFNGTPGRGIRGKIFRFEKEKKEKIKEFKLNNDGRSDSPILKKEEFAVQAPQSPEAHPSFVPVNFLLVLK